MFGTERSIGWGYSSGFMHILKSKLLNGDKFYFNYIVYPMIALDSPIKTVCFSVRILAKTETNICVVQPLIKLDDEHCTEIL